MSKFHRFEPFCKSLHMEFKTCSKTLKMIFDKFKKTEKFSRNSPLKMNYNTDNLVNYSKFSKGKKAMNLALGFSIFLTVILLFTSLMVIYSDKNEIVNDFKIEKNYDSVYMDEQVYDFYINKILDKAIKDFYYEDGVLELINRIKNELAKYKDADGSYVIFGFEQIESQIIPENIDLSSDKIVLRLNYNLEYKENFVKFSEDKESFSKLVVRFYPSKVFEKRIVNKRTDQIKSDQSSIPELV
jgi:hypothetical protein